jgi:hypothetical protein
MTHAIIARYGLAASLLTVLPAGCSGSSVTPGPAAVPNAQTANGARSWMASSANARRLLYVTRPYDQTVDVYTYPQDQMVGQLTGFLDPLGSCTDKRGNVYITDLKQYSIVEYAHGGTQPVQTLSVPGINPVACAVDRRSGDLAVATTGDSSGAGANVAIFPKATGTPKTYTYAKIRGFTSCAYDNKGNLFVDGTPAKGYGYDYELAELPRRAQSFQGVDVQYGLPWGAPLQWYGKYLAAGEDVLPKILRYAVAAGYATFAGATPLSDAYDAFDFVIAGKKAIVANIYYVYFYVTRWDVLVYGYPAGGDSTLNMLDTGTPVGSIALSRGPK